MARPGVTIPIYGDTRPLMRDIKKASSTPLRLGKLDDKPIRAPLGRIRGDLGEFEKSLEASNARVLAFGASAGAIYALGSAFSELVRATIDVEKNLAQINVILGTSANNLNKFGNDLFAIAVNTEQSFSAVSEAAAELARQGLGLEETLKRTSDALVLTRLSGLSVVDSVNSITAALNGFQRAALTSTEVINKIIAVDQAFAVSGKDLAEALRRVGSTAESAGVSLDELMAVVTSAQQITARGGAVIGNSFKTIFTRIQRPRVLDALNAIGVATRDASGASLSAITVLNNLAGSYDKLASGQKAMIAELIGGVFQVNILKASLSDLRKQYSIYGQALNTSISATDEAQRRNEQLNKTLSATANETVQNLMKVGRAVGTLTMEPAMRKIMGGLNKVLGGIKLDEAESVGGKIGKGILSGIGDFLKGPGILLAGIGIYKIFERLKIFAADAFKTISGLNIASSRQGEVQRQIFEYLSKNPQILGQIHKGTVSIDQVQSHILVQIQAQTRAYQEQLRIANSLGRALASRGVTMESKGALEGMLVTGRGKAKGFVPNFVKRSPTPAEQEASMATKAYHRQVKPRDTYTTKIDVGGRKETTQVNKREKIIRRKTLKKS